MGPFGNEFKRTLSYIKQSTNSSRLEVKGSEEMSKSPVLLTIGKVAQQTGLRTSALRYYESMGILPEPVRISGHRRYNSAIFEHIHRIQAAQRAGFSIEEIRSLLETDPDTPYSERLQALAARKLAAVEQLISDALMMKRILEAGLGCACPTIDACGLFTEQEQKASET